jgi:hypothetical protein
MMMSSSSNPTKTKNVFANSEPTLEDKFLLAKLSNEIENETDIKELKKKAILLAKLAIMRQGMIKGLAEHLLQFEVAAIHKSYEN